MQSNSWQYRFSFAKHTLVDHLWEHLGDGDIVSVNDALRQGSVPALRSERPFVVDPMR